MQDIMYFDHIPLSSYLHIPLPLSTTNQQICLYFPVL